MARSINEQALAVIKSRVNTTEGIGNFKPLQSIRSINDTAQALAKIGRDLGVQRIKHITPKIASEYLRLRQDNFASQKSLDRDRKALAIALQSEMPRLTAITEQTLSSRAYSRQQVSYISQGLTECNRLGFELAHSSGLRAHELLTLKRMDEGRKTSSRTWTEERFLGRSGEHYLVTGKGGLTREVIIPKELSQRLESCRLDAPKITKDRGVNYVQRYDIGGGNALSAAVTRASQRILGFSHGLHGVRHSYAQDRLDEIKLNFDKSHEEARDIISQELGHFRGDITEVYLR